VNVYPFVEAEKVVQRNVAKACALLEVSRSAFYEWSKHTPSLREISDGELTEQIEPIHARSRGTYGWPRVRAELRSDGIRVAGKRVARIMRQRFSRR
jgi:putative transposase